MKLSLGFLSLWVLVSGWSLVCQGAASDPIASEALWSTRNFRPTPLDSFGDSPWDRTTVDRYIRAQHEAASVRPQARADERILLRRVYLDLLGMPPTPKETNDYLSDSSPDRYSQKVDQLLASPAYGERWARHWLDVARFAESSGFEHDSDRPHAFPYRDFVIQALNQNLPFNTFLEWQIAGDELSPENALARAATGFLGAGVFPTQLTEKEFESARYDELDDIVSTIGTAMLGLSVGCARCHDHKFDPIPAADYYRLAATFTKTIRTEVDLVSDIGKTIKTMVSADGGKPMKHAADGRGFPHFYPATFVLKRGDASQKGPRAEPGFLTMLRSDELPYQAARSPRSNLAKWITDIKDGGGRIAARVIVNRLWQHHFGNGLVTTPNDFGTQGALPSHPALLDWLAEELVRRDWNLKAIQRIIVTSAVYCQASTPDEEAKKIDPQNRLLWRFQPRRLEAEAIRDSMLAVSAELDATPFGPGTLDSSMPRRSIYFFIKRSRLIPFLLLFDFPEPLSSIGQRAFTNIAPQGLNLMNSPTIRGYARSLTRRARTEAASEKSEEIIQSLYELAYNRRANPSELDRCLIFLEQQQEGATISEEDALSDLAHGLFMSNEFLYQK